MYITLPDKEIIDIFPLFFLLTHLKITSMTASKPILLLWKDWGVQNAICNCIQQYSEQPSEDIKKHQYFCIYRNLFGKMCDGKNPTSLQSMKTQLEQYQTTKFKNERNVQALLTRTINELDYFFRDFINPYADLTKSSFIRTLRSTILSPRYKKTLRYPTEKILQDLVEKIKSITQIYHHFVDLNDSLTRKRNENEKNWMIYHAPTDISESIQQGFREF